MFGALGVVVAGVALWVQWIRAREERRDSAVQSNLERERFERQIGALQQADNDRLAAQARRVVPSLVRASTVIPNLWHVRIDNLSTDVISALEVDVSAVDQQNEEVQDACMQADRVSVGDAMAGFVIPIMDQVLGTIAGRFRVFADQVAAGVVQLGEDPSQVQEHLAQITAGLDMDENAKAVMKEQVKHVIAVNITEEWPTVLSPGQFATMAFILDNADLVPRLYMRFEDSTGYTWERTDVTKPTRVSEP